MAEQSTPKQAIADQAGDLAGNAVDGIRALSPADKSWVAAVTIIFLGITGVNAWVQIQGLKSGADDANRLVEYLINVESNRATALDKQSQLYADQMRRAQETIKDLTDAVARDSERAGMAALSAIDKEADSLMMQTANQQGVQER